MGRAAPRQNRLPVRGSSLIVAARGIVPLMRSTVQVPGHSSRSSLPDRPLTVVWCSCEHGLSVSA